MPPALLLGTAVRASLGVSWPLIPSEDTGESKKAIVTWKHLQNVAHDRSYDHRRAAMWSVVTGKGIGIVVFDFDGKEGNDTRLAWGMTEPHVRTGSGGHHVYVTHPGYGVKTYAGGLPGVDIRADGGIAHVAGASLKGPYTVLRSLLDPMPFSDLPAEALEIVLRRQRGRPDNRPLDYVPPDFYREAVIKLKVAEMQVCTKDRNQTLNRLAWELGKQRIPYHEAHPAMMAAALAAGLGEAEAGYTIKSGWNSGA